MSIKQKNSDTAAPKGSAWKKNVIFALVVLALAAGIFLAVRAPKANIFIFQITLGGAMAIK